MADPTVLVPHFISEVHFVAEVEPEAFESALVESLGDDVDLRVAATPPETERHVGEADVLLTSRAPPALLDRAPNVRWIQAVSAGVECYDTTALADRGVALTNASGVAANPVAEQVLGYLLGFERGIHRSVRRQHRHVWESRGGGELRDRTVGVIGMGAIGRRVTTLCDAVGTSVFGVKRDPSTGTDVAAEVFGPEGLYEVLRRADYVVLACPLTEETEGLLGEDEIATMSADTVVVNVSRGGVIDEPALVRALQQDRLGGAALDVFAAEPLPADSALWDLSNVVVTPHSAGSTPNYYGRVAELFAENYRRFAAGRLDELTNRVV